MKFDFKGTKSSKGSISDFEEFLKSVDDNSVWEYMGLTVEIDPTIDYNSNNVLIRWLDIDEGFNDKIIYHNLAEFKKDFKLVANA